MDHDSGVITRPKFRIWVRPDGIVQLTWVGGRNRSAGCPRGDRGDGRAHVAGSPVRQSRRKDPFSGRSSIMGLSAPNLGSGRAVLSERRCVPDTRWKALCRPAPMTQVLAAPPDPPAVVQVESVGDKLRQLAALRDDGIISAEEFEAKKADLLRAF